MPQDDSYIGLIVDLGMSEGNDTDFYLKKGFKVIGVEADGTMADHLRRRFTLAIASGQLQLLNFAASSSFGNVVQFFRHEQHQGLSGLEKHHHLEAGYTAHTVMTIDWNTIVAQAGVPYYLKIDIEGQEAAFLSGMLIRKERPTFISIECHSLVPVEVLFELGYRRFKLVDQNPPEGFRLPDPQVEGCPVTSQNWTHSSGPFGRELPPGKWLSLKQFNTTYASVQDQRSRTWFDCHAWMPSAA